MMAESQSQMAGGKVESRDERHLFPMLGVTTIVLLIAACKLVVHLYAGHRYGYLGDELYYLACSRHLAWGYVDQPPLIAMIARRCDIRWVSRCSRSDFCRRSRGRWRLR